MKINLKKFMNSLIKFKSKFNIHIYENGTHIPFCEYYKPDFIVSDYYIERIYSY